VTDLVNIQRMGNRQQDAILGFNCLMHTAGPGDNLNCVLCSLANIQCLSEKTQFSGFPVSQGTAVLLGRWGGKTKHHL